MFPQSFSVGTLPGILGNANIRVPTEYSHLSLRSIFYTGGGGGEERYKTDQSRLMAKNLTHSTHLKLRKIPISLFSAMYAHMRFFSFGCTDLAFC